MSAVDQKWSPGQERNRHCHPGGIYLGCLMYFCVESSCPWYPCFSLCHGRHSWDICYNSLGKGGAQPGLVCSCTRVLSRPGLRLGMSDALRSRRGEGLPSYSLEKQAFFKSLQCTLALCSPWISEGRKVTPMGISGPEHR